MKSCEFHMACPDVSDLLPSDGATDTSAECPGPSPRLNGLQERFRSWLARNPAAGLIMIVAVLIPATTQAQTVTTFVSNTGQTSSGSYLVQGTTTQAQGFTTGDHAGGYTLSEVVVAIRTLWSNALPKVSIYTDLSGKPGTSLYVLTNPSPVVANSDNTFTAPAGATLDKETVYFVVVENESTDRTMSVADGNVNDEDSGAASGWSINDDRHFKSPPYFLDWTSQNSELRIAIKGTTNEFDAGAATGKPTIAGTANVGQTLTADTSGIADANGKTKADNGDTGYAWTYQWVRVDGTAESDITGATSETYMLVAADEGKRVKVRISFSDDADNDEGPLASDAWPAAGTIASAVNNAATGKPTITGTAIVGDTVTASTSGIADSDGKTKADNGDTGYAWAYQWVQVDGTNDTHISGANASTYTLAPNDQGKKVKVIVGFTDDTGHSESLPGDAWPANATVQGAGDATLKTLAPSITLSQGFDPATFEYAGTVPNYASRISFDPETNHSRATLVFLDADDMPLADVDLNRRGHQVNLTTDDNIIKVRVTAEDGMTTKTYRVTVTRRALPRITVRPRYPSFGAGLEDVLLDVTREEPTTAAVTVTMNIAQEQTWLSSSHLSHQVTIEAGRETALLILSKSWFSLDVPIRGNLTASVATIAGYDVGQASATVEMISIPVKPLTVEFDKTAYIFAEDGDPEDVEIFAVFTLHPAFPRPPADFGAVSVLTSPGTASSSDDYEPVPTYGQYGLVQFFTRDFVTDNGRFVARIPVRPSSSPTSRLAIVDDDVYEGSETFHINLGPRYNSPPFLRYQRADRSFCEGTCTNIAYPVTITDEEDLPELSLSVSRPTIDEDDDTATTAVAENISTVIASVSNGKTFKEYRTITLTFGGTATAGTHYTVSPVDADSNTAGHQVALTAGSSTVSVMLTANGNTAANTARTITVAGSLGGASFGTTQTVTINDSDGSNNLPAFANATVERSIIETVGDAAAQTAIDIGAALPAATDDDEDTLTYSLQGTDATSFGFDASARQFKTKPGTVYDYEARSSYSVTVQADDGNGGTATTVVTVSLTNAAEVPSAPSAPTVSEVSGDSTVLNVGWVAPGNGGRPAITGYDIQYKETSEPNWTNGPQDQAGTSASIGNLTKDTEYQVQVRATNADGDSSWSLSGTGRTDDNWAPVYSPDSALITFAERVGDVPSTTAIDMGRHTATDGDGDPLTYSLEGPDKDKFTIDAMYGRLGTKVGEIFDYEAQSRYSVTVKADDGKGGTAAKAIVIGLFDAIEAPLAPAAPTVSGGPLRLDVGWNAPDPARRPAATGYELRYKKTSEMGWTDGPQNLTRTNSSISGLTLDTEYQVQVRAINRDGKSVWSSAGVGRTTDEVGVTGLSATGTVNKVDLSWTEPQGTILGYRIEVSYGGGSVWADVEANTNSTDTRYTHHSGLAAGETRRYRVSAIIAGVTIPSSEWAEVSATVVATGLSVTGLSPEATSNGATMIELCWMPVGVEVGDLRDFALRRRTVDPASSEDWGNQVWSPWGGRTAAQCANGIGFRVDVVPNVRYAFQLRARSGSGWILSNSAEGVFVDTARTLRTEITAGNSDLSGDTRVPDPVCPAYDDPGTPENDAGSFIISIGFTTMHPVFLNYQEVNGFDLAADVTLENATAELIDQPYHDRLGYRVRITPANWGEDVTVSVPAGAVTHSASLMENQASNEFSRKTSTATSCEPEPNLEPLIHRASILDNYGRDGKWMPGDRILVTLDFTEEMTVATDSGVPTVSLLLEDDTTAVQAQYVGTGSNNSELMFEHHVGAGHGPVRRVKVVANSLVLNGGEIVSSFGVSARLEHLGVTKRVRPAPVPQLTAEWTKFPPGHSGRGKMFRVRVKFSKPVTISAKDFRDHALSVTGGDIDRVWQVKRSDGEPRKNLWGIKVTPNSEQPVTLLLAVKQDCNEQGAICTADGTATAGEDYTAVEGTLIFERGETSKTVSVPVLDDAHDDDGETLTLTLSNPKRGMIVDGEAVGTIRNSDPLQQAWLARFGRAVGLHVTDAVGERLRASPGQEFQVTVGGYRLMLEQGATEPEAAADPLALLLTGQAGVTVGSGATRPEPFGMGTDPWADQDPRLGQTQPPSLNLRDVLLGSSFRLALGDNDAQPGAMRLTAWGRVAGTQFDGRDGDLTLDGDMLTGTVGVDSKWERWLAGVAVSHSRGDGSFNMAGTGAQGQGDLENTLTSLHPYLRYVVTDRLDVWGLLGYGWGDLTLEPGPGVTLETDTNFIMGAVGARGILMAATDSGGFELATRTDALFTRMSSDAVTGLASADADAHRLRLVLEGTREVTWPKGQNLTPAVEVGLRHDWGDAETGFGLELGGRVRYADPNHGLTLEGAVRGLLAHEDSGYDEWGASATLRIDPGSTGQGLSLTLSPTWGAASSGVDALWSRQTTAGQAQTTQQRSTTHLNAEMGYGLTTFGTGLLTPYTSALLSDGNAHSYRLGTRWTSVSGLTLNVEGTRQEQPSGQQSPTQALRLQLTWDF